MKEHKKGCVIKRKFLVKENSGLHARNAAILAKKANEFQSDIFISKDGKEADAKSIMGILSLAAGYNQNVYISAKGDDAKEATDVLGRIIEGDSEE